MGVLEERLHRLDLFRRGLPRRVVLGLPELLELLRLPFSRHVNGQDIAIQLGVCGGSLRDRGQLVLCGVCIVVLQSLAVLDLLDCVHLLQVLSVRSESVLALIRGSQRTMLLALHCLLLPKKVLSVILPRSCID